MRGGICSKCGGREVYASRNGLALGGGYPASVKAHIDPGFRGMRAQQATDGLWQYACANCGYCEIYLLDDAVVDFVRQAWVRVPVADTADAGYGGGPCSTTWDLPSATTSAARRSTGRRSHRLG